MSITEINNFNKLVMLYLITINSIRYNFSVINRYIQIYLIIILL